MATSIFLTRRLLPRLGVKRMLLLGLTAIGLGPAWLSQITASGSYQVNVLTAFGRGIAFPTVSIAATADVPARQQGVAGSLFVTAQQVGAAAGLALAHERGVVSLSLALQAVRTTVPAQLGELDGELAHVAEGLASVLEDLQEMARHPSRESGPGAPWDRR